MKRSIRCLGIVANCEKPQAASVVRRLASKARALGIHVVADANTALLVPGLTPLSAPALASRAGMIVALGGDGTLLRVSREFSAYPVPILGINIGRLGFLTAISESDLSMALREIAAGRYVLSPRPLLDCTILRNGKNIRHFLAMNDVVARTGANSRMVSLDVSIDDAKVSSYFCDGIIVASPSGSTGHSLSAGGPILAPETRAFVISLICPHSLNSRPLVIPDQRTIKIEVSQCAGDVFLSSDGQQTHSIRQGDSFSVRRSRRSVRLVHLPGYDLFAVLRQKLNWSGRHV